MREIVDELVGETVGETVGEVFKVAVAGGVEKGENYRTRRRLCC